MDSGLFPFYFALKKVLLQLTLKYKNQFWIGAQDPFNFEKPKSEVLKSYYRL